MLVDVDAAVGNLLQGWDNATIAGMFLLLRSYLSFQFWKLLHLD